MLDISTVLSAAARQGFITLSQAEQIRPKMLPSVMPLEVLDTIIPEEVWGAVLFEIYGLSKGESSSPDINEVRQRIASFKIADLLRVHEKLQTNFERKNKFLAAGLFAGNSVATWQDAVWKSLVFLLLAQAVLGARGIPSTLQKARLEAKLRREAEFLRRFALAVSMAMAGVSGPRVPSSEGAVSSRSSLYSGVPRGEFYEALEENLSGITDDRIGWVMQYIARDDENTCDPCNAAAGYYLPGTGPYPGTVCEGRGWCRCRRVPRYLPEIFRKLQNQNL